jgi:DNA ligase-1
MKVLKDFTTLYIKKDTGKVYQWKISIVEDQKKIYIKCKYGYTDGKNIISIKEIPRGKGKKTIEEQAISEAESKIKTKIDKEGYVNNLQNVEKRVIRPMLASKFDIEKYSNKFRGKKISFPALAQAKYDGIRCLIHRDNNDIYMESRNGIKFMNFNHIRKEALKILSNNNIYLDGELYSDDITFEELSGLTHMKDTDNKEDDMDKTFLIVFDCINLNNLDMTFKERYDYLKDIIHENKYIKIAPIFLVNNVNDVKELHNKFISDGYEGLMLRDINSKYEIKKRSKYLQKYKTFIDDEFIITGFHEGTGNDKGTVIWECRTKDNKIFSVRPRGTREFRSKLFNNGDKYIGKKLTVIYQELTADGIPRFPVGKSIRIE